MVRLKNGQLIVFILESILDQLVHFLNTNTNRLIEFELDLLLQVISECTSQRNQCSSDSNN